MRGTAGTGGEASFARLLASLESPGAFLLDYDVNTTADSLRQTLPEFIRILRERHPETPIVHLSSLAFPSDLGPDGARSPRLTELVRIHQDVEEHFLRSGERNLHFVDGSLLLGEENAESSADGCHLNDSGFRLFAGNLAGILRDILRNPTGIPPWKHFF